MLEKTEPLTFRCLLHVRLPPFACFVAKRISLFNSVHSKENVSVK